jgi:hypothetical protein
MEQTLNIYFLDWPPKVGKWPPLHKNGSQGGQIIFGLHRTINLFIKN